jgi:hypothetical protein
MILLRIFLASGSLRSGRVLFAQATVSQPNGTSYKLLRCHRLRQESLGKEEVM